MKRNLLLGLSAAGLLSVVSVAGAQQSPPNPALPPTLAPPAVEQGTVASKNKDVTGELKSVDKEKRSLTIAPMGGAAQDFKLADSAIIQRDGITVGLANLQDGERARASCDPA